MADIRGFRGEYRWLSNFWFVPVIYDGHRFETVEHGYQAMKCKYYEDFIKVKQCTTPSDAKKFARNITMRDDWDTIKTDVMYYLLQQKFKNPLMLEMLLKTGNSLIVEENYWGDTFWGVCRGTGENMLGKMIMKIRDNS